MPDSPKFGEQREGPTEVFGHHVPLPGEPRLLDLRELHRLVAALEQFRIQVGTVNARPPGAYNSLIQFAKKSFARLLVWYIRPLQHFNLHVNRSLEEIVDAIDHHSMSILGIDHLAINMLALEGRLAQSEQRIAALVAEVQEQLKRLQEQVEAQAGSRITEHPGAVSAGGLKPVRDQLAFGNFTASPDGDLKNDRTTYIVGLFGTGRSYINELILQNIGERSQYLRDTIRFHPGPTPMIYSGHVTMKHFSRAQASPAVMNRILEAVRLRFADVIFLYRHPLDSLLTNWVWWRTYIRENRITRGISEVYRNTDDLCADLEQNFLEFQSFARGDAGFFAALPGPPFLSFQEFVEETQLHTQSATLSLRLEDFISDPYREFSKIVELMFGSDDASRLSLPRLAAPRTKAYGYLAVREKVPRFREFVNDLDPETKQRIETMGYNVNGRN